MSEHGPILVPLDGSDLGEQAVPVAAALAKKTGAELHLIHVHVPWAPEPIYVEGLPVIGGGARPEGARASEGVRAPTTRSTSR